MNPKRKARAVNLVIAVVSTLLTLTVLELTANIYLTRFAPDWAFKKYASLSQLTARSGRPLFEAHRYLGFIPTVNFVAGANQHNSLGFRGPEIAIPKPDGVFRIVCIGASTTYGAGVEDYKQAYPYQLREALRTRGHDQVEVVNAGVFSYTSLEELINLEQRVLPLQPDLIIIYEGVNEALTRLVWPPEMYRGDLSGYEKRLPSFQPPWYENITLVRAPLILMGLSEPQLSLQRNFMFATKYLVGPSFVTQKLRGNYPRGIFKEHPAAEIFAANPPIYYERNLRALVEIASARNIGVVLLSFTSSPHFPEEPRAWADEFLAAYREQNDVLRRIASDTPAHFFDFAAVMPTDAQYFSDGIHFSRLGNQTFAGLLANYLDEQSLVSKP